MTVSRIRPMCQASDGVFGDALRIIENSAAAELVDQWADEARGRGGRSSKGVVYTVKAVLVALLVRIMLTRTASLRGALETIADFAPAQLAAVGMEGADPELVRGDYSRFSMWLEARLAPLDQSFDVPARRMTNGELKALVAARTRERQEASAWALERSRIVMNRIVAGSVWEQVPGKCVGDLVADESIFDLTGPRATGLGSKDHHMRAAAHVGGFYYRKKQTDVVGDPSDGEEAGRGETTAGESNPSKSGFGVGVTAVTRIGRGDELHAVAPVVTGIDVHSPTSGSVDALAVALRFHKENGFDCRRGGRARWPRLAVDMGYNAKKRFDELMVALQYNWVGHYVKSWNRVFPAVNPPGSKKDVRPGPEQGHGAFYCEAAAPLLDGELVPRTRSFSTPEEWRRHDDRLAALLPLLTGLNGRPKFARANPGRPHGAGGERVVKLEVGCPAVQCRVRCPLKPESMELAPLDAPTVEPKWTAEDRALCSKSSITVTLTPDQLRMAQFDLVPGSWEHLLYIEAARSLTEQRFSFLKNKHVTAIDGLEWAPRREPMLKIIIALMVAAANHRSQQSHADKTGERVESIVARKRALERRLGRPPAWTPPRT